MRFRVFISHGGVVRYSEILVSVVVVGGVIDGVGEGWSHKGVNHAKGVSHKKGGGLGHPSWGGVILKE